MEPQITPLAAKVLPEGTDIQFVDNKNKVKITLPESFITVNGKLFCSLLQT